MMSWWLLWPVVGLLSAGWLWFMMTFLPVKNAADSKPIEEITLGNALSTIGITLLGMVAGPLALFFAIMITWEELKIADIIIWRRKPLDLQMEAKKQGYELKPLKGMDDA